MPSDRKGRLALLASIGKEIAKHEAALVELRRAQISAVKMFERNKYADEIEQLRALVVNYEGGLVDVG